MRLSILYLSLFSLFFISCQKEQNRKSLNAFFKYDVNGSSRVYKDEILLKENTFECYIKNDTLLYIHATKGYEGGGFILKLHNSKEGLFNLDGTQKGFYEDKQSNKIYYTNHKYKGIINFKTGTFTGATTINTLEGNFEYEAVDASSGKSYKITNGTFLMELKRK